MRFFTLDWYHSQPLNDVAGFRRVIEAYARHLERMDQVLPPHVVELARLEGVDDGLLIDVRHDCPARTLQLTMRCGDLQMGYYDLVLTYEECSLSRQSEWSLARVARSTVSHCRHACDVAYHEVDRAADGRIVHRLLFHPGVALAIHCGALRWERIPTPGREFPRVRERFPGGPRTPPKVRIPSRGA